MRIAFVTPPFAGHLNPQIPLGRAARRAGYSVEFITGERKWATLAALGFDVIRLPSLRGERLEAIANWPRRVGSNPVSLLGQLRKNLELLPEVRRDLVAAWKSAPPDLVVADFMAPIAGVVCEEVGIPWITTIATPFAIEQRRGPPPYLGGWSPGRGLLGAARDAAGRRFSRLFKRAVFWSFRDRFGQVGFHRQYRDDGTEAVYSPRAILGFGIQELEFDRDWPPSFQMIGAVVDPPEDCPPLQLPDAGKRVLVTLGTHLMWAKKTLLAHAARLAEALPDVQFVVSLGRPEEAGGALEQIASRVLVCPFVSYARDLPRFDAVVHHGGAGIVNAAIVAGVPSLAAPHDYDHFDYSARVAWHGLGLRVRSLSGAAAQKALRRLLDRSQWPAVAKFQAIAARYRPEATFLEIVKGIIG